VCDAAPGSQMAVTQGCGEQLNMIIIIFSRCYTRNEGPQMGRAYNWKNTRVSANILEYMMAAVDGDNLSDTNSTSSYKYWQHEHPILIVSQNACPNTCGG